jgi:flagellar basal-body rod protein FlgC
MSFFTSLSVSTSGLKAERLRADLASANLANANSTRTAEGGPYRRRDPVLGTATTGGAFSSELDRAVKEVSVRRIVVDMRPPRQIFSPSHPDADENGMLSLPNIRAVEEITNLTNASRAFQANVAAIKASRDMAERALRIGK